MCSVPCSGHPWTIDELTRGSPAGKLEQPYSCSILRTVSTMRGTHGLPQWQRTRLQRGYWQHGWKQRPIVKVLLYLFIALLIELCLFQLYPRYRGKGVACFLAYFLVLQLVLLNW